MSFHEAFAVLTYENSPISVNTVFKQCDFQPIRCSSDESTSDYFYLGIRFVAVYGRDGKKMQLHEYTYTNGVLKSSVLLDDKVLSQPVNEIVIVGTKAVPSDAIPASNFGFSECKKTSMSFTAPIKAPVKSLFGFYSGEFNRAIAFDAELEAPFYADCDRTVTALLVRGSAGLTVELSHGSGFVTSYCGLQSTDVSLGDAVISGNAIGTAGTGGLRIEMFDNGLPRNPLDYIKLY